MSGGDRRSPFALVLRRLRLAAGLSQEQLAERARVSLDAVGALERGTRRAPYRETVEMLAHAVNASDAERAELHLAARRPRKLPGAMSPAEPADNGPTRYRRISPGCAAATRRWPNWKRSQTGPS